MTDGLGGSVAYGYNGDNQLTSLALSLSSTMDAQVTLGYDAASRLTGLTRTGVSGSVTISSSLSYDKADRLTNITDKYGRFNTILANYTYIYDPGSELTSYTDNSSNSLMYGYDADGQLTSVSGTLNGSSYSASYSYDTNGNRTMTGYSTGTGNELQSDGTYSYTYDNNGNLSTQTNISTHSVTNYTWDYRNRLTEVKEETSLGTVIYDEKYTYDVNNNRIGVSLGGTQQLYTVYDGANPYIDFNGSGTLTQRYLVNPQALSQFYGQVNAGGTTQWFLTDNINSVRQVVSTSGSVLDAILYDPYGNIVNQTSMTYEPRFLYTGGAYDSLTGGYQFGARSYGPSDGRFESQDPMGFAAGDANLYRYVFNSPLDRIDPTGFGPNGKLQRTTYTYPKGTGSIYLGWPYYYWKYEGKDGKVYEYNYGTGKWSKQGKDGRWRPVKFPPNQEPPIPPPPSNAPPEGIVQRKWTPPPGKGIEHPGFSKITPNVSPFGPPTRTSIGIIGSTNGGIGPTGHGVFFGPYPGPVGSMPSMGGMPGMGGSNIVPLPPSLPPNPTPDQIIQWEKQLNQWFYESRQWWQNH